MSKHIPLYLTSDQRAEIESFIKSGNAAARVQTRARILLLSDRSQGAFRTDSAIASVLMCSIATISNVRQRFLQEGLEASLWEKSRPGRPPKITGDIEAQISVLACSDPPDGQGRWTVRLLTSQVMELGLLESIDHTTLWERMKKTNLNPGK